MLALIKSTTKRVSEAFAMRLAEEMAPSTNNDDKTVIIDDEDGDYASIIVIG